MLFAPKVNALCLLSSSACFFSFSFSDPPCLGDFTSHSLSISVHLIQSSQLFFAFVSFSPFVDDFNLSLSSTWYGIKKLEAH